MPELTFERLQFFLFAVFPGFVAMKVYDLFIPSKREVGASIVDAVCYSLLNLAVWSWLVIVVTGKDFYKEHTICFVLISLVILVLSPAMMGIVTYRIRISNYAAQYLNLPTASGWDHFFYKRQSCFILFFLKNKDVLAGYYGKDSYVTTFPHEQEIYVEQVWRVDEHHCIKEMVHETLGMIIRFSECDRIEFLRDLEDLCQEQETQGSGI